MKTYQYTCAITQSSYWTYDILIKLVEKFCHGTEEDNVMYMIEIPK